MENLGTCQAFKRWHWQKIEKTMRVFVICMCFFSFGLSAETLAQSEKVRLNVKDATLETVFNEIQRQTNLAFLFNHELVADLGTLSLNVNNVSVEEVLNDLFEGTGLTWSLTGNLIVVKEQQEALPQQQVQLMTITGTVKDAKGMSLPGVAVIVKGTTIGTATDINGKYSLSLPAADYTLVFSMMGMKSHEEVVGDRTVINVTLQEDIKQIDEVVVTGYQTISKERATGAYAIVDTKVLEQKPTANLSEALNGLVPGLVTQSGSVGEDARFIIRGKGTLQEDGEDTDPLIVVDGFAISGYAEGADPFSTINPNDVESVTVLKDAAATSIYGARAANGVIVITTKKGKAGNKLDISADAFWAVSSRADLDYYFNMASAENQFRYVELVNSYNPISFTSDPYTSSQYHRTFMPEPYRLLFELSKGNIDEATYEAEKARLIETANQGLWEDDLNEYIFRNQFHHQYNVALRGASEKINYAFSASYDGEKGYLQGDDNQRVLLNMSSSAKLTKNLTFDASINSTFTKKEDNGVDLFNLTYYSSPWSRLVDDEGNFIHMPIGTTVYEPILESVYEGKTAADWHYNPAEDMQYMHNLDKSVYFRAQGGLNYATTWGLNVSAKGQYEWRRYSTHEEYDPESYYVRNYYNTFSTLNAATGLYDTYFPQGGIFTDGGHVYEAYNLRGQADYNWTKDAHALTVLAGTEILSSTTETTPSITRYGYNKYTNAVDATIDYQTSSFTNIFGLPETNPFKTLGTLSSYEDRFFSVYANAAYTYDDRYSVTGSFRTDASNYQSESQRDKFSPFWSVGASWLLSNEHFLENSHWLNQLKLRASFGIAGVAAGKKATSSVTTVSTNSGTVLFPDGSNSIMARGNETLTWEKSRTFNVGMDFAMFGNKFSGSVEFYNRFSYDVLSNATVSSAIFGTGATTFNNAEVLNRGVEFSLSSDLPIAGDLRWQGVLNYAYNYNEVTKFSVQSDLTPSSPGYMEGYPIGAIIALKPVGYTPEGYILLQGKDGTQQAIVDGATSHSAELISRDLDKSNWFYYIGTTTPKSNLSFSNYFTYKGLTLSFMITGRFGYYVNPGDYLQLLPNNANYSKQLDKAFEVYDEGYANQDRYSGYPLYNDDNSETYIKSIGTNLDYAQYIFSTNYIKGDHIRLNEVFLGYDLPQGLLEKQGVFSRINVYARASNLGLIWSKNGEMDPDYPVGNIKPMPTFTFGLKLAFKNW